MDTRIVEINHYNFNFLLTITSGLVGSATYIENLMDRQVHPVQGYKIIGLTHKVGLCVLFKVVYYMNSD